MQFNEIKTEKLHVEGMTCGHCVKSVEKLLASLPGVTQVEVDLEKKSALVQYDPSQTDTSQMIAVFADSNYTATPAG